MSYEIEQEFLQFDDLGPDAGARVPPPIGIERGVARRPHYRASRPTPHRPPHDPSKATGVIRVANHDDRSELMPLAPDRKDFPLVFSATNGADSLDARDPQLAQLSSLSRSAVFIRNTAAQEFLIRRFRRVVEHGDTTRDPAPHQVGRFEDARRPHVDGEDNHVGGLYGIARHQQPAYRAQDGPSSGDGCRQNHTHDDEGRDSPPAAG